MIDLINPQDKVVVIAAMTEKDMLVDIIARVKSFSKFYAITSARAAKMEIIYSFFTERSSRKIL